MPISDVFNEDCMIGMARYPDNFFDLAIVDPPYGIGVSSVGKMTSVSKKTYDKKDWDKEVPPKEYFDELKRVSKHQIIWGANFFDNVGLVGGGIVWNKLGTHIGRRNPMSNLSDCELAWCSMRNNIKMFSYTYIGNVTGNNYQVDWDQNRIHPTQKPIQLYEWCLKNYADEGWKILDSHMGSQSSRIASFNMGFDYYGFEIDEQYFNDGNKRFKEQTSQTKLF